MSKPNICPKCAGAMVQGFLPDFTYGGTALAGWHKGPPEKSFWKGTKVSLTDFVPVGAFRCDRCGFLELYANEEFAAK